MKSDPFSLNRFLEAQAPVYDQALTELKGGQKESHWMWFIFPQIDGLGSSPTARFYALKDAAEAQAYLAHPILGQRLTECCHALLNLPEKSAPEIFGSISHLPRLLPLSRNRTMHAYWNEKTRLTDVHPTWPHFTTLDRSDAFQ